MGWTLWSRGLRFGPRVRAIGGGEIVAGRATVNTALTGEDGHAALRHPGTRPPPAALGPDAGGRRRAADLATARAAGTGAHHRGDPVVRPPPRLPRLRRARQRRAWDSETLGCRHLRVGER